MSSLSCRTRTRTLLGRLATRDLIRFGKYIETGRKRGFPAKDHMVLFPIPPKVITESGGVVKNNPGYE